MVVWVMFIGLDSPVGSQLRFSKMNLLPKFYAFLWFSGALLRFCCMVVRESGRR